MTEYMQRQYGFVEPQFLYQAGDATDLNSGNAVRYLPPDIPGGFPVQVVTANINNEAAWPSTMQQVFWGLAVDPAGDFVATSGWPAAEAGTSGADWGLQFQHLIQLASLAGGPGMPMVNVPFTFDPPIYINKSDPIIVIALGGGAGNVNPKPIGWPSWRVVFKAPLPTQDQYTKLLLHGELFTDQDEEPLPQFASDSSPSWHRIPTMTATINTTTPVPFGSGSIRFNGSNGLLAIPGSRDWLVKDHDWTMEMLVRPDNVTTAASVIAIMGDAGTYGPFSIAQVGNRFVCSSSSNGTSWNVVQGADLGPAVAEEFSYLVVQRKGSAIELWNNGSLITSVPVSGALFDAPAAAMYFGNNGPTGSYPFAGNLKEVRFSRGVARFPNGPPAMLAGPYV